MVQQSNTSSISSILSMRKVLSLFRLRQTACIPRYFLPRYFISPTVSGLTTLVVFSSLGFSRITMIASLAANYTLTCNYWGQVRSRKVSSLKAFFICAAVSPRVVSWSSNRTNRPGRLQAWTGSSTLPHLPISIYFCLLASLLLA